MQLFIIKSYTQRYTENERLAIAPFIIHPTERKLHKMHTTTLLETHKLTKSFQGKTIIDHLDLNIKKAMYTAFSAVTDRVKQRLSEC